MFILNLILLILNSFFLSGIFGANSFVEFFCVFIIFFYSQVAGISIILGLLKHLSLTNFLFFSLLIFLSILPFIKKFKLPQIKPVPLNISIFLSFAISVHIIHTITILPLPPLTTDGLLYHLPFAVHYYKTHSISLPNLYFTDIAMTYYPIGGEIFYTFSLFSGKEFLFKYTQFPFLLLGCFSLFLIFHLFFFGLFSYFRNFLLTGNPFYPAEIKIGNFVLFSGAYIYPEIQISYKIKNLSNILAFSSLHIDPSLSLKILLLLFFLISLPFSFKNKKLLLFYSTFPISIFLYCILIPPHYYQIRHLLPLYGILCLSIVYPFRKFEYFFIPLLLYFFLSSLKFIFFPKIFLTFLFLLFLFFPASYFKKYSLYFFYFIGFILFSLFEFAKTEAIYENIKFETWKAFYKEEGELWEFVEKNSKEGKNIAYVGNFLIYPFYGEKFNNNVFYQSVNSIETLPVFKYRRKIEFPKEDVEKLYRNNPDFNLWISGLKKKKTDWIIVKKDREYFERKWIEKEKEFFKLIFSNNCADIYKVNFKNDL